MLKGAVEALLIPPISLLLLAIVGLLIERRHRLAGRLLAWTGLLSMLVLAMPVVGGALTIALEHGLPLTPPVDMPPQAIVILGGDAGRGGENMIIIHPGPLSLEREREGAIMYRRTRLPILVSGGPLRPDEPPIGSVMADSLQHDFQVPVQWVETTSHDTWTNAQRSAEILRQHGIRSVYLVTQAWHMRRAIIAFAHTGIVVTAAPTRLDQSRLPLYREFTPDLSGWRTSFYALHEWFGCAYYALR